MSMHSTLYNLWTEVGKQAKGRSHIRCSARRCAALGKTREAFLPAQRCNLMF